MLAVRREPLRARRRADHVQQPGREAVGEQEVGHRLRGRDHVPEPRQRRLERQVAVLEPGEPASRDARRVRGVRAADPRCDLLRHPVQRMEHAGAAEPAGEPPEQPARRSWVWTRSAPASFRHRPAPPRASSLWPTGTASARTPSARKLSAAASLRAEHVDVDSRRGDARSELPQVRNGAAALDRRDVDDLHPLFGFAPLPVGPDRRGQAADQPEGQEVLLGEEHRADDRDRQRDA